MKKKIIYIGTRGSKLAIYQAEQVKTVIENTLPGIKAELRIIKTKGDKILDVALSKIGDKGLFTKEIENALLRGEVDVAVHSLKDLPTLLPSGLALGAVLERGDFRDVLVSKSGKKLNELTHEDIIATSSLRRSACLLRVNGRFQIKDIRGNVNTRLEKMQHGYCDAMVMAAAGLQRLGLEKYITEFLDPDVIVPAVSQGVIALEIRENDDVVKPLIEKINHSDTWQAIMAERAFLRAMEGGCQVPVGCFSKITTDVIQLTGFVASLDGKVHIQETLKGSISESESIGKQLAKNITGKGGKDILKEIRKTLNS